NVVEPALSFLKALLLAQAIRDQQRRMEEQLPVVRRIRSAVLEVDILPWIGAMDERRRPVLGAEEATRIIDRIARELLCRQRQETRDPVSRQCVDKGLAMWMVVRNEAQRGCRRSWELRPDAVRPLQILIEKWDRLHDFECEMQSLIRRENAIQARQLGENNG